MTAESSTTPAYLDWGLTHYSDAVQQQMDCVDKRLREEAEDLLIFTEHHPVYTTGTRVGAANHLIWDAATIKSKGIELHASKRGGDITYHGPGQVVGYPIIDLSSRGKDLHLYLRNLEQVIINTTGCLGLPADRREGKTGIWVGTRKIAAIGVAVRKWITWHGFALNVNNDLSPFEGIVPCGITDGTVTSLKQELGFEVELDEVKSILAREFWKIF